MIYLSILWALMVWRGRREFEEPLIFAFSCFGHEGMTS